jgi:competence protein ComGC
MGTIYTIRQAAGAHQSGHPSERQRNQGRGFVPVEIVIVVLIIGILVGIAVPNFAQARKEARQKACISNLRMIDAAKKMWALDNKKPSGTPVRLTSLMGTYIDPPQVSEFRCPSSGQLYSTSSGSVGAPPLCPTRWARTGPYAHVLYP